MEAPADTGDGGPACILELAVGAAPVPASAQSVSLDSYHVF